MVEFFNVLKNLFITFSCLFTIFSKICPLSNAFWLYQHGVKRALFQFYSNLLLMIYNQNIRSSQRATSFAFRDFLIVFHILNRISKVVAKIKSFTTGTHYCISSDQSFGKAFQQKLFHRIILQNNSKNGTQRKKVPYNIFFMIHYYVSRKNCKSFS